MSNLLRSKGKNTVVWVLMALLVLGLGGFGLSNFSGSIRTIGKVGNTEITVNDYVRALRNEINAFSAQVGQTISMAQATAFGLDRAVLAQLLTDAALDEQAANFGLSVGDDEVRRQIVSATGFQGLDGKFDRQTYALSLRQQGLTEAEFEASLRRESARLILQAAVVGGITAPEAAVATQAAFVLETRSLTHAELTAADLASPLADPSEADLRAYHAANAAAFTSPETRDISYVWLTPEMLQSEVTLDEATLRDLYQARIGEFVVPERRLVEQLVYPSDAEATAAKARYDAGTASFADLVTERGLSRNDVDLGDVAIGDLGDAGEAVFAAEAPALLGPLPSDFGPALYAVNAVLQAQEVTFEEARDDLAAEATLDRARRMIADQAESYADLLAGGATLEDIAKETPMQLGTIHFAPDSSDGIAAYEGFRTAATAATAEDFPELANLDDGGVFALRLDQINAPALIPYEEVADAVRAAWVQSETHAALLQRAQEIAAAVDNGARLGAQGLVTTSVGKLPRGGFLEGLPAAMAETAFEATPGNTRVIDAEGRVLLLVVDAVHAAAADDPDTASVTAAITQQVAQSLSRDLITFYGRAAQNEAGLSIDSAAIAAVQAQLQ
jgi:peptidyl-prolyl cis-trans isomerase D